MSDPLKSVSPGERIEFRADTWNAMLESTRAFRDGKLGKGSASTNGVTPALTVFVKNTTAGDLAIRSVLKVSDSPIDPTQVPDEFRTVPVFEGEAPDADTDFVCVLAEAVRADSIGRAVIVGVTAVTVDVGSASDEYAKPIVGDTGKLESSASPTSIRLLVAGGTGERTCVVVLQSWGGGSGSGVVIRADASGAGPVSAFIQGDDGAGGLEDVGDSISVKKFTAPAREDFEENGYYIAVQVGEQWYAETGPKTTCIEVLTNVECADGSLDLTFEDIRVIDRECA